MIPARHFNQREKSEYKINSETYKNIRIKIGAIMPNSSIQFPDNY